MKRLIFIFLLLATPCFADYYIVNQDNQIIGITKYVPDQKDLSSRNEIAIEVKENISMKEAEYRDGKVIKHKKTQSEIKADNDKQTAIQDKEQKKQSALNKLKSILTDDEIKALFN